MMLDRLDAVDVLDKGVGYHPFDLFCQVDEV